MVLDLEHLPFKGKLTHFHVQKKMKVRGKCKIAFYKILGGVKTGKSSHLIMSELIGTGRPILTNSRCGESATLVQLLLYPTRGGQPQEPSSSSGTLFPLPQGKSNNLYGPAGHNGLTCWCKSELIQAEGSGLGSGSGFSMYPPQLNTRTPRACLCHRTVLLTLFC